MLSELKARGLKPAARDQWIADGRNGLYLRVRSTGGKSWVLRRKRGGKAEVITLGTYPKLGVADARRKAQELAGKPVSNLTLNKLLEEWHEDVVSKTYRLPRDVERFFKRYEPELLATKLRNLDRLTIRQSLRRDAQSGGRTTANRALSILKTALRFAVDAGYIESNPAERLSRELIGGQEQKRTRVLTDEEIRALWIHEVPVYSKLYRFLLLTGQRIGETQKARWEDFDGDRWHIPAAHTKNKTAHWVALSTQAVALLDDIPRDRNGPFGEYSNLAAQAYLREYCRERRISPSFTPHDLRRTFATRLSDLGVMPHIVEKILNHTLQGVMAVYNRAEYADERVAAMQMWANVLTQLNGQRE